jgi:transcriptional regulator with GAF, ATPase, and Fis domain
MNNAQPDLSISSLFENTLIPYKEKTEKGSFDEAVKTYDELKEMERNNVVKALKKTNYRIYGVNGAAELLKIKPTTLMSKIKALKIPVRP